MDQNPIKRFDISDSQAAVNFYEENGFVIVKNFYPAEDLQDFKTEVKNIINAHLLKAGIQEMDSTNDDILSNGILALEEKDHEYVAAIYDTIFQSPSFFRILGNRNTESYIKDLLDIDSSHALYGFTNRCRIDPPKDNRRTYGWHQEVFYTVPRGSYIQTWAPLIFVAEGEGGLIGRVTYDPEESYVLCCRVIFNPSLKISTIRVSNKFLSYNFTIDPGMLP